MSRAVYLTLFLTLLIAGCIPAQTPDSLDRTPGPGVVLSDRRYDAGAFSAEYPSGWRVITSPAEAPPSVIFASPDQCAVILVTIGTLDAPDPNGCDTSAFRRDAHTIGTVRVVLVAPGDAWNAYAGLFDRVTASVVVAPPDPG